MSIKNCEHYKFYKLENTVAKINKKSKDFVEKKLKFEKCQLDK